MMKKSCAILMALGSVFLLCIIGYLGLAAYYSNGFTLNTWINGVYCTGKTIEEVNAELLMGMQMPDIVIKDREGREWQISSEEIAYQYDYLQELNTYCEKQNPFFWPMDFGKQNVYEVSSKVTYNEEKLRALWNALPCVEEALLTGEEITIVRKGTYYVLHDETRQKLNVEKAYRLLQEALERGNVTLDLVEENLYEDLTLTQKQLQVMEQWEKVKKFQEAQLIFDMGDARFILDASNRGQFLLRGEDGTFQEDEQGDLMVSRELTDAFIDLLANQYDTYGRERNFQSTRGDMITLSKGTYGTLIDREAEKGYLYEALTNMVSETHVPTYKKEAYVRGREDIGLSYIEIDMTNQKMYLYKEGKCLVETDVVTGNLSKKWGTPEGLNYVYAKQTNRVLRGADYASFVYYWMPVNGGYGIHDANWRKSFGGEIYKKNGSHGCINTPYQYAKEIYENIEVGYPVIMFY